MNPVGHLSASYVASRAAGRLPLLAVVLGGWLVDIDVVLLPFEIYNEMHHIITHNLLFLAVMAGVGTLVVKENRAGVAVGLALGGALHLLADSIIDTNPTNGIGIAVFWPITAQTYAPFNLVPEAWFSDVGWLDLSEMLKLLLFQSVFEVPLYVVAGVLLARDEETRQRIAATVRQMWPL